MITRYDRKWYLLYPEDRTKNTWDSIVSVTLLLMCIFTPIYIAFSSDLEKGAALSGWQILNISMDSIFGIDILVTFVSAFYDDDFKIVDDVRLIFCKYFCGWFLLDLFAILPFDFIFEKEEGQIHMNSMARIAKIGRVSKIIKLTRLLRMVKIIKKQNQVVKWAG